jgi:SAM-dependent methyltransferase
MSSQGADGSGVGCVLCGDARLLPALELNGYTIAKCQVCGLLQVRPMPQDAVLSAHYAADEYFRGDGSQGYDDYAAVRKALTPLFSRRMAAIAAHLGDHGRLLDFGCAAGYFLDTAEAAGWQADGVEVSPAMAARAAARPGRLVVDSAAALPDRPYDAIALWEVVEHLTDPLGALRDLRGRLRAGGMIALSTPNTGNWQAVRNPCAWEGFRPPSHLTFLTRETLRRLLETAGFAQVDVVPTAPSPTLPSLLERPTRPLARAVKSGSARPWPVAVAAWRAVRLAGMAWQRVREPGLDIHATLEATALNA